MCHYSIRCADIACLLRLGSDVLGQIGRELIHGPAPALTHAVAARVEGLALGRRRVVGLPSHRELGSAARRVLEAEDRHYLQRPGLVPRMACGSAGLLGERPDERQTMTRY